MNQKEHILQAIRKVRKDVVPANGKVVLFGSQALRVAGSWRCA